MHLESLCLSQSRPSVTVPLAVEVMKSAQSHFDAAETYRHTDWTKFSTHVHVGCKLESAAQLIESALGR